MANQEKRQTFRVPSSRPVVMIFDNQTVYATMTDFSRHGIGFMSSRPAPVHDRVEVHFDILGTDGEYYPFQYKAEVKHCMQISQECHIGVRLDMPSTQYRNLVAKAAA